MVNSVSRFIEAGWNHRAAQDRPVKENTASCLCAGSSPLTKALGGSGQRIVVSRAGFRPAQNSPCFGVETFAPLINQSDWGRRNMPRRYLFKLLVPVVLAVIAVSASAAQAAWQTYENQVARALLPFQGTLGLHTSLVPGLLQKHCTGGTFTGVIHNTLILRKLIKLNSTGCKVKDSTGKSNSNCTVNTVGEPAGTIALAAEGNGQMEGSKTFAVLESENFGEIEVSGALCPLDEFDATLSGSITVTLDNAATEEKVHGVKFDDQALFYGEYEALLHGATEGNPVTGSAEAESGESWSVTLKGL